MSPVSTCRSRRDVGELTLGSLPYVALTGCVGIAVDLLLSFEEPHLPMLLASFVLMAAAPLGLALHLALTHEMALGAKRLWLRGLVSRSALTLFAAYFSPGERRQATRELVGGQPIARPSRPIQ